MVNLFSPLQVNVPSVTEDLFYGRIPGITTSAPIEVVEPKPNNYFVDTNNNENAPYPPEAPDWKLRGESAPMPVSEQPVRQEQGAVQVQPSMQEDPSKSNTWFNWRGVLDNVLNSMNSPENDEKVKRYASNVNQWVQGFGTSPFLALADPENAVHRLRQQANANMELAFKSNRQPTQSSFMQKVNYLRGLGYTPKKAYEQAVADETASKSPLVQVGGEGETSYQKERGKAFAGEMADAVARRERNINMSPDINVARTYLSKNPDLYLGKFGSSLVQDMQQSLGWADKDKQIFNQALSNIASNMRANLVKSITGGGQISNKEQEYVTAMLPGVDKTVEQNLYILNNLDEINRRFNNRVEVALQMEAQGYPYYEIMKKWGEMQKEDESYFDNLYKEYLALGKEKGSSGSNNTTETNDSSSFRVIGRVD